MRGNIDVNCLINEFTGHKPSYGFFHIITLPVSLVTLDFMGSIISQFPGTFPGKNFVIWHQLNEKTETMF